MEYIKENLEKCMIYKCKTCPKAQTCQLLEQLDILYKPLTYKPFENLKEIRRSTKCKKKK